MNKHKHHKHEEKENVDIHGKLAAEPKSEPMADIKADDSNNKLLRIMADFDNYKKRTNRERQEIAKFANELLIVELLPVIDGFERAMQSFPDNESEDVIKGIALIKKQFEDVLAKSGVKPIETLGKPFDPNVAEAVTQIESDQPEHTVIEEMQKGYTLHGKLIRPAMVVVSKKKT
jgi:molecular chaperone GrpE